VVVSGQKLWSTSAHHAELGLLLARTDWDAPKHRGITCFALPMHQAGVEARPAASDERARVVQRGVHQRRADPRHRT
jgi:alkylation response protein AidB-like acyl-CoA dehydrogenase